MSPVTAPTNMTREHRKSDAIKRVIKRILPLTIAMYTIGYLDQTNVGVAALRMRASLGMSQAQYGFTAGIFALGLLVFSLPANLIMKRLGAQIWLTGLMIVWGGSTIITGFVHSTSEYVVVRFILGCAEAGLFPGLIYYMSIWIPPYWRARAVAIMAFPFAMILGAPLSGALMQYGEGWSGLEGWRVMFVVEGLGTLFVAAAFCPFLTPSIQSASWLSEAEKAVVSDAVNEGRTRRNGLGLVATLRNPELWMYTFAYLFILAGFFTVLIFMPQMVSAFATSLHLSLTLVQVSLLSAIPYGLAGALGWFWTAHSDRTGERRRHCFAATLVGAGGMLVSIFAGHVLWLTFGLTLAVFGIWGSLSPLWPLALSTVDEADAPAAVGLMNMVGNLSGLGAPYVVGLLADVTGHYSAGMSVIAAAMVVGGLLAFLGRGQRERL